MKTLFIKSNTLHIRTNEGEFEVSNPEGALSLLSLGSKKDLYDGKNIEWPGEIEFIHQVIGNLESRKWWRTHEYMYSKFPEDRRRKLARLIPEDKKSESAYKEFKPVSAPSESQEEVNVVLSDLTAFQNTLHESGLVTFRNLRGDIISVKGMIQHITKLLTRKPE